MASQNNEDLVKNFILENDLHDQVESNRQTFVLLVADEKFQKAVSQLRSEFNVPQHSGFQPHSKVLKQWLNSLDETKWQDAIHKILVLFPRINENFLQHIELYIKFNNLYYGPIFDHQVSYMQIDRKPRDWVNISIYNPPDEKEWKRIRDDIDRHFQRRGVERTRPIKKFEDWLSTLQAKGYQPGTPYTIDEIGQRITDDVLAHRFNKSGSINKQPKAINLVRKYRQRINEEKKKRLG